MKLLLPFFGIIFFSVAFGQSPKKLNKLLRAQLALDRHKQDSAHAVFLKDKNDLEELRSEIHQKVRGPLADAESEAEKSVFALERKSAILKALGVDPKALVSDTVLPKYPYTRSRDVIKSLGEAWDRFPSFDLETRIGSDLDQFKVKEQNERLFELISSYQHKFKDNQLIYQEQREYITRLEEFRPTIDRLIILYKDLNVRADKAYQVLRGKADELEANYKLKGPKGFPEVYQRVFPKVHPVKVIDNSSVKLSEGFNSKDNNAGDGNGILAVPKAEPGNHSEGIGVQERIVYQYVDEPPSFPGGLDSLKKYLKQHIHYPEIAKDLGVEGKVFLRFVISDTGEILDVKVLRGVPDCPECDHEALRVIKGMPNWIPGKVGGKPVNSFFNLPILFKLN